MGLAIYCVGLALNFNFDNHKQSTSNFLCLPTTRHKRNAENAKISRASSVWRLVNSISTHTSARGHPYRVPTTGHWDCSQVERNSMNIWVPTKFPRNQIVAELSLARGVVCTIKFTFPQTDGHANIYGWFKLNCFGGGDDIPQPGAHV